MSAGPEGIVIENPLPRAIGRVAALPASRLALLIALVILALVAIGVFAGQPRQDQLVVGPTFGPSVGPTAGPSLRPTSVASPAESLDASFAPDYDTGFAALIAQDPSQPWSSVRRLPNDNPRWAYAANQLEVIYGGCPGCAGAYRIDVTFGTAAEGVVVGRQPCRPGTGAGLPCAIQEASTGGIPELVQGDTTEALAGAWLEHFGEATATTFAARRVDWTILHYADRVVALVVRLDQAVAVSISATPYLTTGQRETLLPHFLDLVVFETELPSSRVGTIGDIEVAIPAGWILAGGPGPGLLIVENDSSFLSIRQLVSVIDPGDTLLINRPNETRSLSFTISGATFKELVASINEGLGDATGAETSIAGAPGFRWHIPQRTFVGPLAGMAAFEWNGRFYVFQVHFPVDAAPGDVLGPVLDGVTLR